MTKTVYANSDGFTLIEMLIVISIIGILAALLTPVIRSSMRQSAKTSCVNNLKQIAYGLNQYTNQNNDHLPYCTMRPSNPPTGEENMPSLRDTLKNYIGDPGIFLCPGDPDEEWFKAEGMSYEWFSVANGRMITRKIVTVPVKDIAVLYDYDDFHGEPGDDQAKNYLFISGRVAQSSEQ